MKSVVTLRFTSPVFAVMAPREELIDFLPAPDDDPDWAACEAEVVFDPCPMCAEGTLSLGSGSVSVSHGGEPCIGSAALQDMQPSSRDQFVLDIATALVGGDPEEQIDEGELDFEAPDTP